MGFDTVPSPRMEGFGDGGLSPHKTSTTKFKYETR